ncbi:MAG: hypothetical protein QOJ98_1483 [Acidobacteriota bacterium]|jgi:hypothetical protein|nr:hypothetical protein [Acidobacteriota bacterium]
MVLAQTFSNLVPIGFVPADRVTASPKGFVLDVTIPKSADTQWCWAAVAVGLARAYQDQDPKWADQCEVATRVKKASTCCPAGDFSDCNLADHLPPALEEHFDSTPINPGEDKTFKFVVAITNSGFPLAIRLGVTNDDAGHFVVIAGYRVDDDGTLQLWIGDPEEGLRNLVDFEKLLVPSTKERFWTNTFRTTGAQKIPEES